MSYRTDLPRWKKGHWSVSFWWAAEFIFMFLTDWPLDAWLFLRYRLGYWIGVALGWLWDQPFTLLCRVRGWVVANTCRRTYHLDRRGIHICDRCGCWLGKDNEMIGWEEWEDVP